MDPDTFACRSDAGSRFAQALVDASDVAEVQQAVRRMLPEFLGALHCELVVTDSCNSIPITDAEPVAPTPDHDGSQWAIARLPGHDDAPSLHCRFAAATSSDEVDRARADTLHAATRLIAAKWVRIGEVASLRRSVDRLERAERLQGALYAIADLAGGEGDIGRMLSTLHRIVAGLMYAENFYIVLYDPAARMVRFPYFVDTADTDPPADGDIPIDELDGSLTWHLLQSPRPLMGTPEVLDQQVGRRFARVGPPCVDWLGVPLVGDVGVVGGIVVQSYTDNARFSEADSTLLSYVAQHILTALERKGARDELERRVAERTEELREAHRIVQHQMIERLRGERMKEVLLRVTELANATDNEGDFHAAAHRIVGSLLDARNFYVALIGPDKTTLTFPYSVDEFDAHRSPRAMARGLTEYVLRRGTPLLADRAAIEDLHARGDVVLSGAQSLSWLGVPLICDGQTTGVLVVQSYSEDHRYTARDQALMTFVSYHIANALERKHSADSLRRAYAEMEQRIAERTAELATANRELRDEIAQRERIERQLKHETLHDSLTGLPNRTLLLNRLDRALARYRKDTQHPFAVLFLDLDRFKVINDSVGHLVGDELLEEVGRRIADSVDREDTVARLGGDEFAILLNDIHGKDDAMAFAARLIDVLGAPVHLGGKEIFTSASVGIALVAPRYGKGEELLRDADLAMYRAKSEGRNRLVLFDEHLRRDALDLLGLESDLRRAVTRAEFEPYFQPIVDLRTGATLGYEALMRWNHPSRGVLFPGDFLAVAEDCGLGEMLDWQIIERVCATAPALAIHNRFICINLAARHFRSPQIAQRLLQLLHDRGIAPTSIRIEVIEHVLLDNPAQAKHIIQELRAAGIGVLVDDFGTGYSSLSYLHQFPLKALKIDRSFIAGLTGADQQSSKAVVRAILALAGSLGMDTVAEGIETEAQRDLLLSLGCHTGQGYLLGHPQPASAWLAPAPQPQETARG